MRWPTLSGTPASPSPGATTSCTCTPTTRTPSTRCSSRSSTPTSSTPEEDDVPKGTASADLLGDVFVAADRLQHDGEDGEGTATLLNIAVTIDDLEAPYGMGARDWESICAVVGRLADVLAADKLDEEKVTETAREVRAVMRPFV